MQYIVIIKWRGNSLGSFAFKSETTVLGLKKELERSSGVEHTNQKLLCKGRILKDEEFLSVAIGNGHESILMMGTPSAHIPKETTFETIEQNALIKTNEKEETHQVRLVFFTHLTIYVAQRLCQSGKYLLSERYSSNPHSR